MNIVCVFFFFRQKTAYEMRISDWSSDVCSSDRPAASASGEPDGPDEAVRHTMSPEKLAPGPGYQPPKTCAMRVDVAYRSTPAKRPARSEERRVGKACVSPSSSRGTP